LPDITEAGTIFVREGAILPEALGLTSEPIMPGWRLVKNFDGEELDRKIRGAGWTFFCMAGEIRASVFGHENQEEIRQAVKRILAKLNSQEFNSLEITAVASKRFLGVPYVTVSARLRHIQESMFLFRAQDLPKWGRAKLAA